MGLFILALEQRMSKEEKKELAHSDGFIAIWRCIEDHWVFNNAEYFKAWCIILMHVQHKTQKTKLRIKGKILYCSRGESLKSLDTWLDLFGKSWTKQKLRTFIKALEEDQMINTQNERVTTRLSVCNYDTWQYQQHDDNMPYNMVITRKQHDDNTVITSDNKVNKEDKVNKEEKEELPDWLHLVTFENFKKMRKKIKSPMTEEAESLLIKKLETLGVDNHQEILEQSIMNSWRGVFELKTTKEKPAHPGADRGLAIGQIVQSPGTKIKDESEYGFL